MSKCCYTAYKFTAKASHQDHKEHGDCLWVSNYNFTLGFKYKLVAVSIPKAMAFQRIGQSRVIVRKLELEMSHHMRFDYRSMMIDLQRSDRSFIEKNIECSEDLITFEPCLQNFHLFWQPMLSQENDLFAGETFAPISLAQVTRNVM